MADQDEHLEILVRNRFKLVQHLQVERSFLFDYLLSKHVFDRDDYDLVRSEKTREQKAAKVVDILETKGEDGFNHFKDALQLVNPSLYEMLTGQKATSRNSPILDTMDMLGSGQGLNHMIDQDILSSHLKRVTDDLRDMTLRYNNLLKENQQLRKAVDITTRERKVMENRMEIIENELAETEAAASKTFSNASISLMNQYKEMQQDRNDNKDLIIQLQMRLLQCQEEYEKRTQEFEDYQTKCDNLEHQLSHVNENYMFQRCETQKLSARLKSRTEEAKYCTNLKQQIREKQYQVMELKSESEDKSKELDELKNWTEALKSRYDSVIDERSEILLRQRETFTSLSNSHSDMTDMDIKMKRLTRELNEHKRERTKLEKETLMFKNQANSKHEAYIRATEKIEELKAYYNELLVTKDKEVNDKNECMEYYQNEVEDLKLELSKAKGELKTTLNNNDDLILNLNRLRNEFDKYVEQQELAESEKQCEIEKQNEMEKQFEIAEADGKQECSISQEEKSGGQDGAQENDDLPFNWKKKRATNELLDSIRRRFKSPSQPVATRRKSWRKSLNFDDWLRQLAPAYTELSPTSKKAFSLQRAFGKKPMQTLSYETLSCMYSGGSKATEPGVGELRRSSSRIGNKAHNRHEKRKSSSPLPLWGCDPQKLYGLKNLADEWGSEEEDGDEECGVESTSDHSDEGDESNNLDDNVTENSSEPRDENNRNKGPPPVPSKPTFRPRSRAVECDILVRKVSDTPSDKMDARRTSDTPFDKTEDRRTSDTPSDKTEDRRTSDTPSDKTEDKGTDTPSDKTEDRRTSDTPSDKTEDKGTDTPRNTMTKVRRTSDTPCDQVEVTQALCIPSDKTEVERTSDTKPMTTQF